MPYHIYENGDQGASTNNPAMAKRFTKEEAEKARAWVGGEDVHNADQHGNSDLYVVVLNSQNVGGNITHSYLMRMPKGYQS